MPEHLLLRCSYQFKDTDPKNQAVINPCFRVQSAFGAQADYDNLCKDLGDGLTALQGGTGNIKVKAYDLEGARPNYPKGSYEKNVGTVYNVTSPPELAVCLSFYADQNVPRRRGRLYIPLWLLGGTPSATISGTARTGAASFVPIFANLGGLNVDWIVWSRRAVAAHKVTNWFISDAWATQRKRGIKQTARDVGTTGG